MGLTEFKKIFDKHYDAVKNFLYYKLGDIDLAEDLAQEVFMKTWEKRDSIRVDTAQNLLFTIANHLAINHFKSAKTRFEFKLKDQPRVTQNLRSTKWKKMNLQKSLKKQSLLYPKSKEPYF